MNYLGYATTAVFAFLLYRLIRSGSFWLVPSFTALCFVIVLNGLLWSPTNHTWFYLIQPLMIALRACSLIEVLIFALKQINPQAGRWLTLTILGLGFVAGTIGSLMYPEIATPMLAYRSMMFQAGSGMAMAALAGHLWLLFHPLRFTARERAHARVLCLYLLKFPVIEGIRGTEQGLTPLYENLQLVSMLWSILCGVCWLRWGLIVQTSSSDRYRLHESVKGTLLSR